MAELQPGVMAPDFDLPRDGGGSLRLSGLRGGPVVLYFYPKDDTSACTSEAIDFSALKPEFDRIGVRVIGLSPDSVRKHDRFKKKHGLDIDLAADEDKTTLQAYGVWAQKSMFGRKYMGVVRTTYLIDADGRIAEVWPKVRVAGHAQAVLEAARRLQGS